VNGPIWRQPNGRAFWPFVRLTLRMRYPNPDDRRLHLERPRRQTAAWEREHGYRA
jgi:hypothetical protein